MTEKSSTIIEKTGRAVLRCPRCFKGARTGLDPGNSRGPIKNANPSHNTPSFQSRFLTPLGVQVSPWLTKEVVLMTRLTLSQMILM